MMPLSLSYLHDCHLFYVKSICIFVEISVIGARVLS